jgi:hypothetical protein
MKTYNELYNDLNRKLAFLQYKLEEAELTYEEKVLTEIEIQEVQHSLASLTDAWLFDEI